MNFGGFAFGRAMPSRFEEQYHCYSVAYADKAHLEGGDKILLPPSAFDTLARLQVDYPMLFRLSSSQKGTMTHSGVLEFTAEEGTCFIPFWMMQNLLIEEGALLNITNVSLPKATFVKLQPQHVDFLEITNPRAVLEHALRNYSCVTKGDVVCLPYNGKNYHFELKEVEPQDAACIIETDCNVDFDAPVGYKEPESMTSSVASGNGGATSLSASSSLANIPKQSAYAEKKVPSACPSPTPSSMSGTSSSIAAHDENGSGSTSSTTPGGLRIVDGAIVRPDQDNNNNANDTGVIAEEAASMATKTGTTGVQKNAAIAVKAPQVDYWALAAGDGARLDGKTPSTLKDKSGNEIDVRKLRAEAAAKRLAAATAAMNMPSAGTTVDGKITTPAVEVDAANKPPVSKRKSRIGNKFSRLKQSGGFAFEGSGNKMG